MFKLKILNIQIDYDKNYGINQRNGWSIIVKGSVVAELERFLVVAIWKTWRTYYFIWSKEARVK